MGGVGFTLKLDPALVAFDPTDADGNGLPEAVQVNVQGNLLSMAIWNADTSELQVAVSGIDLPMAAFGDGAVVTINLTGVADGAFSPQLTSVSVGSVDGFDIPASTKSLVDMSGWNRIMLPTISK